jgi:hypothetical protein
MMRYCDESDYDVDEDGEPVDEDYRGDPTPRSVTSRKRPPTTPERHDGQLEESERKKAANFPTPSRASDGHNRPSRDVSLLEELPDIDALSSKLGNHGLLPANLLKSLKPFCIFSPVYTVKQQKHIWEIAKEAKSRFSPESKAWWTSKEELIKAVENFASSSGFGVALSGKAIKCGLASYKEGQKKKFAKQAAKTSPSKKHDRAKTCCGCGFIIRFSNVAANLKVGHPLQYNGCGENAVRVTSSVFDHSNGCVPSRQQLVNQKKLQGKYTSECLTKENLSKIIEFSSFGRLSAKTLRKMLKELLPEGVPVNAQLISNIRLKVDRILEPMEENPDSIQHPNEGPEELYLYCCFDISTHHN